MLFVCLHINIYLRDFSVISAILHDARFYFLLTHSFVGITRSIVYNVHNETKENFNEASITTRHSRVK